MNEGGVTLQSLHQIRQQSVAKKKSHRTSRAEVIGGHERTRIRDPNRNLAEPSPQIGVILGQNEDRHDLAGRGDIEPISTNNPVRLPAKSNRHLAKAPIIHVDDSRPKYPVQVKAQFVTPVEVVIEHGRAEVVRHRHSV